MPERMRPLGIPVEEASAAARVLAAGPPSRGPIGRSVAALCRGEPRAHRTAGGRGAHERRRLEPGALLWSRAPRFQEKTFPPAGEAAGDDGGGGTCCCSGSRRRRKPAATVPLTRRRLLLLGSWPRWARPRSRLAPPHRHPTAAADHAPRRTALAATARLLRQPALGRPAAHHPQRSVTVLGRPLTLRPVAACW